MTRSDKGGFARYFRPRTLEQYFEKAFLYGAEPSVLLSLSRLCIESAVWKKLAADRGGIAELRRMAFEDTLKKESGRLTHTDWGAPGGLLSALLSLQNPCRKIKAALG